jgi:hypothetical protein
LDWLNAKAEDLVKLRWSDIEIVAGALLKEHTLDGKRAREIINQYQSDRPRVPIQTFDYVDPCEGEVEI